MPKRKKRLPRYLTQAAMKKWRQENVPETCPILGHEEIDPVVDHDHINGMIRGVVSRQGNSLLGKVENFFKTRCVCTNEDLVQVLHNMADYLEQEDTGILHPVGATQLMKRFNTLKKAEQVSWLRSWGASQATIDEHKTSKARSQLYRKLRTKR